MKSCSVCARYGVVALLWFMGCGRSATPTASPDTTPRTANVAVSSIGASDTVGTSSSSAQPSSIADTPPHVDTQQALRADAAPELVVAAFLEATRRGDDQLAAQLLSKKALEETSRLGLTVKPPGTPQMRYTIDKTEYPTGIDHGVYVHSTWTEPTEQGEESFDIVWVLRKQPEGWRIVGMAAHFADDESPYFLNFEQPEDLYRKMQQASGQSETSAASSGDTAQPAGEPSGGTGTARLPTAPPLR